MLIFIAIIYLILGLITAITCYYLIGNMLDLDEGMALIIVAFWPVAAFVMCMFGIGRLFKLIIRRGVLYLGRPKMIR